MAVRAAGRASKTGANGSKRKSGRLCHVDGGGRGVPAGRLLVLDSGGRASVVKPGLGAGAGRGEP